MGQGTSSNASLSPASQKVFSSITRTTGMDSTHPPQLSWRHWKDHTASQHPLMVLALPPPQALPPPVRQTLSLVTSSSSCCSQHPCHRHHHHYHQQEGNYQPGFITHFGLSQSNEVIRNFRAISTSIPDFCHQDLHGS